MFLLTTNAVAREGPEALGLAPAGRFPFPAFWRSRTARWLFLVGACVLLLAITAARIRHRPNRDLFVSDGFGYYMYLPSLIIDGDLDFTNQLARQPILLVHSFHAVVPETGRPGNGFQIGCALLWLPFFLAAHGVISALTALGVDLPRNGFGLAYELPVYAATFAFGLVGLYYLWRLLVECFGEDVGSVTAFYVTLGTGIAAYLWFEPYLSHLISMSLISILFYVLHRILRSGTRRWTVWVGVGALLGLIALVRVTDALVVLGVLAVVALVFRQGALGKGTWYGRDMLRAAVACAATAFVVFLPQFFIWKLVFGKWIPRTTNASYERMNWTQPELLDYLGGPNRGLFTWTPLMVFAVLGLLLAVRRGPTILKIALVVFVAALYFNSSIPNWWIGCSFGDRRMVDYAVTLSLGLGYLLSLRPTLLRRWWPHLLGLTLCAFNFVLMTRYFTQDLPEYGGITWPDLYVNTFTFPLRVMERFLS